ncbi:MAG: tetratricopeptide repeat protein [Acidobacteriota bacterium]
MKTGSTFEHVHPILARPVRLVLLGLLGWFGTGNPLSMAASAYWSNKEGTRQYNEKNYDEAFKKYAEAQAARPDLAQLKYNEANALYKMGKHQEASKLYSEALSLADRKEKAWDAYNLGNAAFKSGDLEGAVKSYIQALRLDPQDQQAKVNLELALKKQDEQKNQEQNQQEPQKEDQQKQQNSEPQQSDVAPQSEQQDVNQKQTEAMLDYLMEKEKEDMQKQKRRKLVPAGGKDW